MAELIKNRTAVTGQPGFHWPSSIKLKLENRLVKTALFESIMFKSRKRCGKSVNYTTHLSGFTV